MARIFTDGGAQVLASDNQSLLDFDSFSVAFWMFRTATPAAERGILSAGDGNVDSGWFVAITAANLIRAARAFATATASRLSTTAPALNTWVHVLITCQFTGTGTANTDFTFYFNGKSEAGTSSATGSGAHVRQAVPFKIGSSDGGLAPPAQIGGPVALWTRALSPAEALALAGGVNPLQFKEGLVEIFDMSTAHGEEGWLAKLYLAQGATNPTSAAVNPPVQFASRNSFGTRLNVRPLLISRARYFVGGAALFNQAIAATSTFTAALTKSPNYARVLSAASTFTATIARTALYIRTLAVASTFTVALSRLVARFRALPATGAWTAALSKFTTHPVTLAVSGTWTAAIARARGLLMAITSTFSVSLTKRAFYFRALAAGSAFVAVLQRCITKPLAVASTFIAALVKGRLTLKTLAVTSGFTAVITKRLTYARALLVNSTFVAVLTKRLFLSQLLAATSPFTAAISRRWLKNIGLQVSSVFAALLSKIKTAFGLETTDFIGNITAGPRFNGLTLLAAQFDGIVDVASQFHGTDTLVGRFSGTPDITPFFDGEAELRSAA